MQLDFRQISKDVKFEQLLNWLNIPFVETKTELKTETIIVNKNRNLFFYKEGGKGGSVIQFYTDHANKNVKEAAYELYKHFISTHDEPKREIPQLTLQYCEFLEKWGFSKEFCEKMNVGLCKQKSIFNGFICVKTGVHYIGHKEKDKKWLFPKGFTRDILYDPLKIKTDYCIVTADVFDCLYLISKGFNFSVSLMGKSATEKQADLLGKFKRILLIHSEPENIVNRLSLRSFIKCAKINSVRGMETDEIKNLF